MYTRITIVYWTIYYFIMYVYVFSTLIPAQAYGLDSVECSVTLNNLGVLSANLNNLPLAQSLLNHPIEGIRETQSPHDLCAEEPGVCECKDTGRSGAPLIFILTYMRRFTCLISFAGV